MSGSQLVDGKGQLIGGAYNYSSTGPAYATSTYVPATAYQQYSTGQSVYPAQNVYYGGSTGYATTVVPGSNLVTGGTNNYSVGGYNANTVGVSVVPGATTVTTGGQVVGTTVNTGKQVIKGESRIEYVPFEKKIIEYKDQAKVERVPKKIKKVEYKEERKIETIPKEVTVTDYYAVEYLRQYIPQYVPEKVVQYVQVPKKQIRYEYIPVQRQIVHYPEQPLQVERGSYQTQQTGTYVQGGQQQYVSGSTVGQQYVTGAKTYTTTSAVQPSQEKVAYSTNTAISGNNIAYSTGPQYATTYETIPAGENVVYSTNPGNVAYTNQQYYETPQYTYETVPGGQYSETVNYGYPANGNYEYSYANGEGYQK